MPHSISDLDKELSPIPSHSPRSSSSHDSIESDHSHDLERTPTQTIEPDAERASLTYTKTGASLTTTGSRLPSFEVDFAENDEEDPRNWPMWYRGVIIGTVSFATWVVVLYSTSYTSSMPGMMEEFGISSEPVATLGVTVYLLGLASGSLLLAPLSEIYGRRIVYIGSMAFFTLMVLPCALGHSLAQVLVVRYFG